MESFEWLVLLDLEEQLQELRLIRIDCFSYLKLKGGVETIILHSLIGDYIYRLSMILST